MAENDLLEIIKLCKDLDIASYKTYKGIAEATADGDLKQFWAGMAEEEKEHATYWSYALKLAEQDCLPQLFDNPTKIREELLGIRKKIESILESQIDPQSLSDTFSLACRMEIFMTHQAFERLLEYGNCMEIKIQPEQFYDEHINKFIDAMNKFGANTPSLELLGDSLQRLRLENKALYMQGGFDELTGVRNRRAFFSVVNKFGSFARRNQFTIGMIMADIDHFKKVNDTYGHGKGDEVLKRIAGILQAKIRPSDILGRYGGEEFIIYMNQVDPQAAFDVAEKLRKAVETDREDGIGVTMSFGISCGTLSMHEEVGKTLTDFISRADACLYEAKTTGRNKVVVAPSVQPIS